MINTSDLRKGITIELDGTLYNVMDYQHIKMGRGSAQVRLKLRDVRQGHTIERTFQAGEKFSRARLDRRPMQFLYEDGGLFYFMNTETYDQMPLTKEQVGDALSYLKENATCDLLTYGDDPIGIELPTTVELKVTAADPGFRGDTASGASKPATVETGLVVQVPLFIEEGNVLKIDTRSGEYIERVNS
jgi:elongation factor P